MSGPAPSQGRISTTGKFKPVCGSSDARDRHQQSGGLVRPCRGDKLPVQFGRLGSQTAPSFQQGQHACWLPYRAPPWHGVRRCRSPATPPRSAHEKTMSTAVLSRTPSARAVGACLRISIANACGSDAHLPRQTRLPSRRTDTAVSFNEMSRPIYSPMVFSI